MAQRDPVPRRAATYRGDQRHLLDAGYEALVGPDRRGIAWLPCHVDYNPTAGTSRVIYRPVADYELKKIVETKHEERQRK